MTITSYQQGSSHNPYFNRWFSAIVTRKIKLSKIISHNPYFNRWFSAISGKMEVFIKIDKSQSLF